MENNNRSITNLAKEIIYCFDGLTSEEILSFWDHAALRAEPAEFLMPDKLDSILAGNAAFTIGQDRKWRLASEGIRENDYCFNAIVKNKKPLSLKELSRSNGGAKKKKNRGRHLIGEAMLLSDARFVQTADDKWSLTDWQSAKDFGSLKHQVIRILNQHPEGLPFSWLCFKINEVNSFRSSTVQEILHKYPYFDQSGSETWHFNVRVKVAYEQFVRQRLALIEQQQDRLQKERSQSRKRLRRMSLQLQEIKSGQEEAAAALAEKADYEQSFESFTNQLSEKDLLLAMRKKELYATKEQNSKLERKAGCLVQQCRLWSGKARELEQDNQRLKEIIEQNQLSLNSLLDKLQWYKDQEKEHKLLVTEIKDKYSDKIAVLQTEIVEMKGRLEKKNNVISFEQKSLQAEIADLNCELRRLNERNKKQEKQLDICNREYLKLKDDYRQLRCRTDRPLVRLALKLSSLRRKRQRV